MGLPGIYLDDLHDSCWPCWGVVLAGGIRQEAFFYRQANILEELEMTTTIIGIIVTALAIELDKFTQYKHYALPLIALAGVLTVIVSLVL